MSISWEGVLDGMGWGIELPKPNLSKSAPFITSLLGVVLDSDDLTKYFNDIANIDNAHDDQDETSQHCVYCSC